MKTETCSDGKIHEPGNNDSNSVDLESGKVNVINNNNNNNNNNKFSKEQQQHNDINEDIPNNKQGEQETTSTTTTFRKRPRRSLRCLFKRIAIMSILLSILIGLGAILWYFFGWQFIIQLIVVVIVAYLVAGKWRWFYVAIMTAPRDISALFSYLRILMQTKSLERKNLSIADLFQQNVKKHPHKPCIIFEDQEWDFIQVEEYSNKIANVFKSHGYKRGDKVALLCDNKPEFIAAWLGLSKLGVIVPLINTNQRLQSLVHSINIGKSQAVIFSTELTEPIVEILDQIESKVALYQFNCNKTTQISDQRFEDLDALIKEAPSSPPQISDNDKPNHHDHLLYIYTSGTTGLPKAAVISNARYIFIAAAIHWLLGFKASDRFYTPLPLYHTAGGCMTVGQMLIYGSTIVIRKKFSASAYFIDCAKYKCTIAQYIGEMCRYILAVPPKPTDTQHQVRMIYGNGLRPQIWTQFIERFNISRVGEFYGATEGNANIANSDNTVGAIGFVSRILPRVYPISIIKVDPHSGEPIRDARGLCMLCQPNEPGVFIGKIIPNNPSRAFLGYVDQEASKKKIVCDVFEKGDKAFLSGDIVVADEFGYLYFKDRTGDTFRWKGENVSTSEVEAILSNIISYKDVIVYGVEVRGQEGRAGMAAIYDPDNKIDLNRLSENIKKSLPSYARPIFIRLLTKLDLTGTYKLRKTDLQREGFNPNLISDNIYYLNNQGTYELVTKQIYTKINNGEIRI